MSLDSFYNRLQDQSIAEKTLPPVDKWHPDFSGDISIVIDSQGRWFHDGTLIQRQNLVNLFSTILKREGDDFFLVTPVEKWRIHVEVAPLLVVDCKVEDPSSYQQLVCLKTQQGQWITVNIEHPVFMQLLNEKHYPLVHVRGGLNALIERPVYYRLADYVVDYNDENISKHVRFYSGSEGSERTRLGGEKVQYGLVSKEYFFPLAVL